MNEDPKPPILLCSLIALATAAACGALVWARGGGPDGQDAKAKAAAAQLSASAKDLSQLIELQKIYSSPPQEEDPSKYPKSQSTGAPMKQRGPAKNSE